MIFIGGQSAVVLADTPDRTALVPVGEDETLRMAGIVPRLTRTPGIISHVGRSIGADTEAILRELLDASPEALQAWREAKIT